MPRPLYAGAVTFETVTRRLSLLLIGAALVLLAWVFYLGATLRGQAHVQMWSSTWVGLDCLEIIGLVSTAVLVQQRRSAVIFVSALTGTVFLMDAWFDLMLSEGGFDAMVSALFGEIPCALITYAIALTAPAWVRDQDAATAQARRRLARLQELRESVLARTGQR